jgi:hypothetical protein
MNAINNGNTIEYYDDNNTNGMNEEKSRHHQQHEKSGENFHLMSHKLAKISPIKNAHADPGSLNHSLEGIDPILHNGDVSTIKYDFASGPS